LIKNEKANSDDLNSFLEKMGKYKIENIKFNSEIDYKNEIQKQSIILYFELVKNKILSFFQSLYYNQKYQFEYISPVVVVDNSNLKAKIYVAGVNDNSMYAIIDSDTIFMDENKELVYFIDTDLPRGIYEKSGKLFLLNESNYLEENGMDFSFKVQID
jgi:predicted transcriptional regulator with HTH domain